MAAEEQTMLQKWSSSQPERVLLHDFLDWLMETKGNIPLFDIHKDHVLDEYHGIDQAQLEKERRSIVDAHKALQS